jgi:hypothetical protein
MIPPMSEPPQRIRIVHDDHRGKYVGRTLSGLQYFVTTPFVPGHREFVAVYLFDDDGVLLEARIDDLGPREQLDPHTIMDVQARRLAELGTVSLEPIDIVPFELHRFGTRFGFIPQPPNQDDDHPVWTVSVEPGDYMAFYPPWDGRYDT